AEAARRRGVPTVAVGVGGNVFGFGMVRQALADAHPVARECGCPLPGGLLGATAVGFLLPAAVSNWRAYAIAAALGLAAGRRDLLPDWPAVERSIAAPLASGAYDGYSGLAEPTVDGTSPSANHGIHQLMDEVLRLAFHAAP